MCVYVWGQAGACAFSSLRTRRKTRKQAVADQDKLSRSQTPCSVTSTAQKSSPSSLSLLANPSVSGYALLSVFSAPFCARYGTLCVYCVVRVSSRLGWRRRGECVFGLTFFFVVRRSFPRYGRGQRQRKRTRGRGGEKERERERDRRKQKMGKAL